ncbi:DUF7713 domain-containing protein, partial [Roseiconus lacunae]
CFNEVVQSQRQLASQFEHVAVEIPEGSPQIKYFGQTDQWCLRGDVLRCLIDDEDGQPVIVIDDQELMLEQFGKLLVTHAGWGMRLVVVPDDEISISPKIEIREP